MVWSVEALDMILVRPDFYGDGYMFAGICRF